MQFAETCLFLLLGLAVPGNVLTLSPRGGLKGHRGGEGSDQSGTFSLDERSDGRMGDFGSGVTEALQGGAEALKGATASVSTAVTSGLDLFNDTAAAISSKLTELTNLGLSTGQAIKKTLKVPLDMISSHATDNIDSFYTNIDPLRKKDEINGRMREFLTKKALELPPEMQNLPLLAEKYLNSFKERCVAGDCFTLDAVKVGSVANKVVLHLPRLSQVEYVLEVFNQCGADEGEDLVRSLGGMTSYNGAEYFINQLARHNLERSEFLNKNDEVLNSFYYRATLYFKKYVREARAKGKLDSNKSFSSVLGFYVKTDLMRMAESTSFRAILNVKPEELDLVNERFKDYLAKDNEEHEYLANAYAAVCKECLQASHEDSGASRLMMDALNEGSVKTEDICEGRGQDCQQVLEKYIERCRNGDCYTFDNVGLTQRVRMKMFLPKAPQVMLALRLFKGSKAHRGKGLMGFIKKILRMDTEKTLRFFVRVLTRHNVQLNYYNNEAERVLNHFLYQASLFFFRFLTVSRLVGFYSWGKLTMYLFSVGRYRYLKNLAKNVTFGNKVSLASENLSNLMDGFKKYLVESSVEKHRKIADYYSGMCKDVLVRHVNADAMSVSLYDAGSGVKVDDICGKSDKIDCPAFVQEFLDRCLRGDCYTLDMKDYYTHDRKYKLSLPILHQVDAALHVYKNSSSCPGYFKRVMKAMAPKEVDSYVQFYKNLISHNNKNIVTKTFDNEVVSKYLFNSAVYFKFVDENGLLDALGVAQGKESETTKHKMEVFLRRMLKRLVGAERVRFPSLNLKEVFDIYRSHMSKTQLVKSKEDVDLFIGTCNSVFAEFKSLQNNDDKFKGYIRSFEND